MFRKLWMAWMLAFSLPLRCCPGTSLMYLWEHVFFHEFRNVPTSLHRLSQETWVFMDIQSMACVWLKLSSFQLNSLIKQFICIVPNHNRSQRSSSIDRLQTQFPHEQALGDSDEEKLPFQRPKPWTEPGSVWLPSGFRYIYREKEVQRERHSNYNNNSCNNNNNRNMVNKK